MDIGVYNFCKRNQMIFMKMMQQQTMLLRGRTEERADGPTKEKLKNNYKSAHELGLYL